MKLQELTKTWVYLTNEEYTGMINDYLSKRLGVDVACDRYTPCGPDSSSSFKDIICDGADGFAIEYELVNKPKARKK